MQVLLEVVLLDLAPSDAADEAARADRAFNEQVRSASTSCMGGSHAQETTHHTGASAAHLADQSPT